MGRPSDFTQETADAICLLLSEGVSLREICRAEEMPSKTTVFRWLSKFEAFRDQYARAKEAGIEALAEDLLDIADDGSNDWIERANSDGEKSGVYSVNGEAIARSKLRVDTRKWILSKLAPKKYGDRIHQEHSGQVSIGQILAEIDGKSRGLPSGQE